MRPLEESPFSQHFNRLLWVGGWLPETEDRKRKYFFYIYKLCWNLACLYGIYLLFNDFYMVYGDLKKTVWNLCVTILFLGAFTKMIQIVHQREKINHIRLKLHRSAECKNSTEYAPIHDLALKELRFLKLTLYGSGIVFIPIWLLSRYFSRVRELPIPLYFPFAQDLEDDRQYALAFVLAGTSGVYGLIFGMETEMAMFSIFIQLAREYRILIKDIPKLNVLYTKSDLMDYAEVNPWLRKAKAEVMLKDLYVRQKELIECVQIFGNCYSQTFLQQFSAVSILITLLGLQCTLETVDLFGSLMYQIGYLSAMIINLFMLCWCSTKLKLLGWSNFISVVIRITKLSLAIMSLQDITTTQCCEVGEAVYSTRWYQMELETQKGLVMVILRSQHPPKLATGGLMELNVAAFMNRMGNIFSWLVLLRQLQLNATPKNPL